MTLKFMNCNYHIYIVKWICKIPIIDFNSSSSIITLKLFLSILFIVYFTSTKQYKLILCETIYAVHIEASIIDNGLIQRYLLSFKYVSFCVVYYLIEVKCQVSIDEIEEYFITKETLFDSCGSQ